MVAKSGGTMVSGVALAGGRSKRLGRNKAVEKIGDQSLIERVVGKLSQVTSETVVVVAEESKAADLNLPPWVRTAADLYPGTGSLGGIFTGLSAAKGNYGVVVACDMPFLNVDLIRFMLDIVSDYDAVVPRLQGRPEPLHAVYSKSCVGPIEHCLQADQLKIAIFFEQINVAYLEEDDIEAFDPSHLSFFNVNTQEDLDKALALEAEYGLNDE
ncbi:MAG: molybdenum cofactor guanylyltransferase [Chloroflexi bacterium]|nr:molybdenum cofactor guanylyltransferase [Chloroflexota bacterium]